MAAGGYRGENSCGILSRRRLALSAGVSISASSYFNEYIQ